MKKIGTALDGILVSLTSQEFLGLAGQPHGQIPDGTDVSLKRLGNIVNLVDGNKQKIAEIKQAAQNLVNEINDIGI